MYRYGFLDESQNKLDYVLALTPQDVLERRLQVRSAGTWVLSSACTCAALSALGGGRMAGWLACLHVPLPLLLCRLPGCTREAAPVAWPGGRSGLGASHQPAPPFLPQTLVFKLGLAKSIHHARVLIRQRHIRVGKQIVNIPSFMVRVDSQVRKRAEQLGPGAGRKDGWGGCWQADAMLVQSGAMLPHPAWLAVPSLCPLHSPPALLTAEAH